MPVEGESFKPMMNIGGKPCVLRIVEVLKEARITQIVVVSGYNDNQIRRCLADRKIIFVQNRKYRENEMIDSIRLALRVLKDKCDRFMIIPGDMPLLRKNTIRALANSKSDFCVPIYNGKRGHPAVISKTIAELIEKQTSTGGMRALIEEHDIPITCVEVEDDGVLCDINSKEQYKDAAKSYDKVNNKQSLHMESRISLAAEKTILDADIVSLLRMVDYTSSIQLAAEYIDIPYTKAWRQIKNIETCIGIKMVESRKGGKHGGGTRLTEQGSELIEMFDNFEREGSKLLKAMYKEYDFDSFVQKA